MRAAELHRLVENLIRIGTVAEVDHDAARVRVESGDLLTGWLPWTAQRAGQARVWDPPTVGEQVVVLSPGGDPTTGVVLAGIHSNDHPSPSAQQGLHRREYADGAVIDYDEQASKLSITLPGEASVQIAGDATVEVGGDLTATVDGLAAVTAGELLAEIGGPASVTADGEVTVDAPTIKHNGGKGVITGESICHFTGNPHADMSGTVKAGK